MLKHILRFGCCVTVLALPPVTRADFPQFRGTGGSAKGALVNAPLEWSDSTNLAWKVPVPGTGWSQPIIVGDSLFVTSAVSDQDLKPKNFAGGARMPQSMGLGGLTPAPKTNIAWQVHSYEPQSGEKRWSATVCEGQPKYPVHPSNTFATETPVGNSKGIVAFFGATGIAAGLSPDGEIRWKQELGVFPTNNGFGTGSSLGIHDDLVFIQHFTEGSAFVVALHVETGEKKWSHQRERKGSSWASPIVWSNNQRTELVVSGGELIESLDPQSGEVLWRVANVKAPTACSIASDESRIYFGGSDPMSKGPLFALRAGTTGDLSPKKKNEAFEGCDWVEKKAAPGMASPLSTGAFVFVNDNNILRVYETATGNKVNERRIDGFGSIAASPILLNDKILYLDEQGNGILIKADASCETIGRGKLDDTFWATPAIDKESIYFRGIEYLYCIRKTP